MAAGISEWDLTRSVCMGSYYYFLQEFWDVLIPEEPVWNWHIPYLCQIRQAGAMRVILNKPRKWDYIINVPPGTTKSTIFSVFFIPWVWTKFPTARSINASYTKDLSQDLSLKTRDVLKSEKYQYYFPEVQIRKDQDTKTFFQNTMGGSRLSVGVGSSVIGRHAHFLDVDDPIDPESTASKEELTIVNRWMSETLPSRKVSKKVTLSSLIMQRLHEDDPTGNMLAKDREDVKHICLPAELSEDIKPTHLSRYYVDGMLDPVRLDKRAMHDAFTQLGDYGYACQFMQTPIPRGGGAFHTDKFTITDPPVSKNILKVVRYWDKAATGGAGCFTVGLLMALDREGRYWVLDVVRAQLDSSRREALIRQVAMMDGIGIKIKVEQEPGSGGKESAEATVRNLAGFNVQIDRPSGDKELRADPYSAQVNGGNVFLAPGSWNKDYINELKYFPRGKYRDQVDASSGAFAEIAAPSIVCGTF